jgi:hypothetical protein
MKDERKFVRPEYILCFRFDDKSHSQSVCPTCSVACLGRVHHAVDQLRGGVALQRRVRA